MNEGRPDTCVCGEKKEDHFLIKVRKSDVCGARSIVYAKQDILLCPKYTYHTDPEDVPNWYRNGQ